MKHARPSAHLSWSELACKDGTPYPAQWEARALVLAAEFEAIRAIVGQPIVIGSAYRTPAYNAAIPGAAKRSQHMEGRALDLYPPKGWTIDRFYDAIHAWAIQDESKIFGIGRYATFVHIDIRPKPASGRLQAWRGARVWAETKALAPSTARA